MAHDDFNKNKALNVWGSRYGAALKGLAQRYQQGIRQMPGDYLLPEFLTPQYEAIGRAQQQQARQLQDVTGQALGANTSGMLGQQLAAITQAAPYGAANIAARQAGFNRFQQLGQGLQNLKSLESAWRSARVGERQAKQQLENQMFMAGQSAGGESGGGGGLGDILGVVTSLAPLLLL
jgi:hypothetical protein